MNKIVKRKLIGSILCLIIGGLAFIYSILNHNNISDEMYSYMNGFAGGVISVGGYFMYQTIRAIRNPNKSKELENTENDERLRTINAGAMAITFRIYIMMESIASIVCALSEKMEIAKYLGFAIGIQLIMYVITYFIISRKN